MRAQGLDHGHVIAVRCVELRPKRGNPLGLAVADVGDAATDESAGRGRETDEADFARAELLASLRDDA